MELSLAEERHSCQLKRLCKSSMRLILPRLLEMSLPAGCFSRLHSILTCYRSTKPRPNGYVGCRVEVLRDTCAFNVSSVYTDMGSPLLGEYHTVLENIPST